jgi:Glyoxalase-like domain
VRLRQGVVVDWELEPLCGRLRSGLGLGEPFADPGVAEFGLRNAVMALGDTFIEVIAPIAPGAPARRRLERHGSGGYMLIVQVDDVAAARRRAEDAGVRIVWRADLPDISGTHLHPRDLGGTLLSLDEARPAQTWHWAGPEWTGRVPEARPGELCGVTIQASDSAAVAARWGAVLGCDVSAEATPEVRLDRGVIRFVPATGGGEGIAGFDVAVAPDVRAGRDHLDAGGVRFTLVDAATTESPSEVSR